MKVAVIEPAGRLYGSEFCLLDIIDGLPRNRYSWHVILPAGQGFDRLLIDREVACDFLIPQELGDLPKWKKTVVYARILRRLRQLKPDLLYVNQAGSLRSSALYARFLKIPVVCQVQTLEDARWLTGRPELHGVVMAFVCNSQFIAAELTCDSHKKCVLYQGIAEERLVNARRNLADSDDKRQVNAPEKGAVIGILGRIAVSKGHYLLLEAARLLQDLLPGCRFVVIGEGLTAGDTKQFAEKVRQIGLEANFELRGYRSDLPIELSRLDLIVIPSLAEPLGRVIFDAAEQGVPVVLSDAGGLGEIGRRFNIGIPFKSADPKELAKTIVNAVENYSSTCQHFHNAAVSMLERLSMKSYLASVANILDAAGVRRTANEVWLGDE